MYQIMCIDICLDLQTHIALHIYIYTYVCIDIDIVSPNPHELDRKVRNLEV